jgi:nucleoid DNA-binding protein
MTQTPLPGTPRPTHMCDPSTPEHADESLDTDMAMADAPETAAGLEDDGPADLKKRELVEAVVARSGIRKRDAKPAVEAALQVMGEALSEGRGLNLVPLGKLKVTRMKTGTNGRILNARLRQPEEEPICLYDPLAQAAE